LSISEKLFSSKGTKDAFADEHLLIRGLVSNITNWEDLDAFNFGDTFDNWQLLLRRNSKVQSLICTLCDLSDEKAVISDLNTKVISVSNISGCLKGQVVIEKANHIHSQLYQDSKLQVWMQTKEANKLKRSNNYIYIHRPRSWYDWVALDTYRNEIATGFISKFGFVANNKCGNANYYWGSKFELSLSKTDFIISADFDDTGNLRIGVKDDGKSILPARIKILPIDIEDAWLIRKKYSYLNIASISQVNDLISKIRDDVFDEKKNGSVLNTII